MEIISFKINECGFNDTPTWPAWPFFGDDHGIWMSPVMVKSSKVTSIPWLLFCKSSFVINRLKYACVLLSWPHQEATYNISSILNTYQKRREAQVSAQDRQRRIYTEMATQWWRWRVRLRRALELCHNNLLVNVATRYAKQTGLRKESWRSMQSGSHSKRFKTTKSGVGNLSIAREENGSLNIKSCSRKLSGCLGNNSHNRGYVSY